MLLLIFFTLKYNRSLNEKIYLKDTQRYFKNINKSQNLSFPLWYIEVIKYVPYAYILFNQLLNIFLTLNIIN